MKNRIWVGMNEYGNCYLSNKELSIKNGCVQEKRSLDSLRASDRYKYDIYALNLKPLEIVEVIIDTETQKYEVVRPREVGWYLTERTENLKYAVARFWNGENWCSVPNDRNGYDTIPDGGIKVVSNKLPYNEYLRSSE